MSEYIIRKGSDLSQPAAPSQDTQDRVYDPPESTEYDFLQEEESTPVQAPSVSARPEYEIRKGSDLTGQLPNAPNPMSNQLPVEASSGSVYDVQEVLNEYGRPLVKEDFLEDDRLQDIMRTYLETRFSNKNERSLTEKGYRIASTIAGGSSGGGITGDFSSMEPEELFETFQNHQRSFAGGQSVTTVNETAAVMQGDDKTRARLGAGYTVFDAMDNAFIGEGSWAETADAVFDYGKAAIWDPTTILTLGIGKAISAGGTKASSLAFKHIAKTSMKTMVEKGVSKAAASKAVGAATKAAPYYAAEMLQNIGLDAAYQKNLIDTGAQEEYSAAQTGLVAAGSMIFPALMGMNAVAKYGRSKLGEKNLLNYKYVDEYVSKITKASDATEAEVKEVWDLMRSRLEYNTVVDAVDDTFGNIVGDPTVMKPWKEALAESKARLAKTDRMTDTEATALFEKVFLFGNPKEGKKGYYQALKESGFSTHPYMLEQEQTTTGVIAKTMEWLDDSVVEKSVKGFEEATGTSLGIGYTAQELSDWFRSNGSDAGRFLQTRSQIAQIENALKKAGVSPKDQGDETARILAGTLTDPKLVKDPKKLQFALSTYKRLLTSHLSTTGANLKGFGQLTALNAAADVYASTLSYSFGGLNKLLGNSAAATTHFRRSKGSLRGFGLRIANTISPEMPIRYADEVLERFPEIQEKLFREISGDGGAHDSLAQFGMDESGKLWKGVDKVTKGAQTLTLAVMQDSITKRFAFGNAVDTYIMREYGGKPIDFWSRPDAVLEMGTDRFRKNVLDKALNRSLRETASVQWSSLPANTFSRTVARGIEKVSNQTYFGFIMPFGSFFNTTMATMGDLSGVNAMRVGYAKLMGNELDFATQEGVELLAKAGVGLTALGLLMPNEREKIDKGIAWNQEERGDGSLVDATFDWPGSTLKLGARILAHGIPQGGDITDFQFEEVPDDLKIEFVKQSGGQIIRDFGDAITAIEKGITNLSNGNLGEGTTELLSVVTRVPQAVTRPLDPINNLVGVITGQEMNPDRRQGNRLVNDSFRYVNHIFGALTGMEQQEPRAYAAEGVRKNVDLGKQVLGVRSSQPDTLFGKMLNSAGMADWKVVQWDGPPEVKNRLDAIVTPILEERAIHVLGANPNFTKMSLKEKETLIERDVVKPAREQVMQIMKDGYLPPSMDAMRQVSLLDKDEVKRVKDFLGVEGDLVDISEQEDGFETLQKIIFLVKNYDEVFLGNLNQ